MQIKTITSINELGKFVEILNDDFLKKNKHWIVCIDRESQIHVILSSTQYQKEHLVIINERLIESKYNRISKVFICSNDLFTVVQNNISTLVINDDGISDDEENVLLLTQSEIRVRKLLSQSVMESASDIHIVRKSNVAEVWFRKLGNLVQVSEISHSDCDMMMSVIYNVNAAGKGVAWNRREPQDAVIPMDISGVQYTFRYAHMPIHSLDGDSYHVVLRVLTGKKKYVTSDYSESFTEDRILELGFDDSQLQVLKKMFSKPNGLVVVVGTTGSGKSTTIKSMMEWLYHDFHKGKISMLTVEDPVEYEIQGAVQTSIVRSLKNTDQNAFLPAIYSAMRRDPDVLLIGETRDPHTANALVDIIEGGHVAISTLHASSVIGAVQRLQSLGISLKKQSGVDFWSGIICQKLVRINCPECKQHISDVKSLDSNRYQDILNRMNLLGLNTNDVHFSNDQGCPSCTHGSSGRSVVAELLMMDEELLNALSTEDSVVLLKHWRESNKKDAALGKSMKEKAFELLKRGELCPVEFESKFGLLY